MAKQDNTIVWVIVLLIAGAFLYNYSSFFGIGITSASTQYYNKPITLEFSLTNYTNPNILIFFNDKEIMEIDANDTNQTISFTKNLVNGTYTFSMHNISEAGFLKVVVSENNLTETQVINVQRPYIEAVNNIPNTANQGETFKILVSSLNPQGENITADSIIVYVTNPDNSVETLTLTKSGDNFEYNFKYKTDGTYQFKIRASKLDYQTKETSAVTIAIKSGGIPLFMWIWIGAAIIIFLLFIIKQIRVRM